MFLRKQIKKLEKRITEMEKAIAPTMTIPCKETHASRRKSRKQLQQELYCQYAENRKLRHALYSRDQMSSSEK